MNFRMQRVTPVLAALIAAVPFTAAHAQWDVLKGLGGGDAAAPTKQIAYFEIDGAVTETPSSIPPLFGDEPPPSFRSILSRLKEARQDPNVVAIVMDVQKAALGLGQIEELNDALRRFSAADKDVFVHADSLSTWTYAAASGASHISMVPTGDLWLMGVYGEMPFVRGMLDKIGTVPDFEQCGDFKTAAEFITRTEPSEPNKKMTKWLLDGLYDGLVTILAESRGKTPEKIRELIDNGPYSAEEALAAGLIDSVKHRQDFIADVRKRYGESVKFNKDYADENAMDIPDDNIFAMFDFFMKMLNPEPKGFTKPTVAIVYVEGAITTGEAEPSLFGGSEGAYSTSIRKALDKAAREDEVKAVVLRVDSPGGSALASEIILDASRRVAARKPIIVSMGNVAGSGGYYVTCASDMIFADRNTITASIGVIGGKLVTTKTWDKLGVNWHANQRGEMAAMMSSAAPFNDKERAKFRHYMDTVYEIFKKHVTDARGPKLKKPIDEMAGGRVYTGAQALELGLVDKIGGLDEAIKFAANRANVSDYDVRVIPEPLTIFDLFMKKDKDSEEIDISSVRVGFSFAGQPVYQTMIETMAGVDPLRVQAVLRALKRVELIQNEGVIMMMPEELLVR